MSTISNARTYDSFFTQKLAKDMVFEKRYTYLKDTTVILYF